MNYRSDFTNFDNFIVNELAQASLLTGGTPVSFLFAATFYTMTQRQRRG